jgi:hypothetical protein
VTILPNRSMARVCSRQATSFVCRRNLRSRFKGMASRLGGSSPAPLVPTLQCIARLRPNDSRSTSRRRRSAPKGWGCPGCERTRSSDSNAAPSPILARRRSYTNDSSEPDTLQTRFQFQPQSNPKVERRPKPESRSALGFGLRISAFGLRASNATTRAKDVSGSSVSAAAPFPLTPALSPRRGCSGGRRARWREVSICRHAADSSPSPLGRGPG